MSHPNILRNYRHAFKTANGREWPLSDTVLESVIEGVGVLASSEETDNEVLATMAEAESMNDTHAMFS